MKSQWSVLTYVLLLCLDRHSSASPAEQKKQEKLFKELGQAYSVLSDPAKRKKFDTWAYDENSPGDSFSSAASFHAEFDPTMFFTQFMNPQGFHPGIEVVPGQFYRPWEISQFYRLLPTGPGWENWENWEDVPFETGNPWITLHADTSSRCWIRRKYVQE